MSWNKSGTTFFLPIWCVTDSQGVKYSYIYYRSVDLISISYNREEKFREVSQTLQIFCFHMFFNSTKLRAIGRIENKNNFVVCYVKIDRAKGLNFLALFEFIERKFSLRYVLVCSEKHFYLSITIVFLGRMEIDQNYFLGNNLFWLAHP